MSYFYDQAADLAIYEAPKNGGTTLRLWIAFKLTGQLHISGPTPYYTGTTKMTEMLTSKGYRHRAFTPITCRHRICIKRDPVERFISCYQDKIVKESGMDITVSEFLHRFEEILASDKDINPSYGLSRLAFHFKPQSYHFGTDQMYYDRIFTVHEMGTGLKDYLEERWNLTLPVLHARRSAQNHSDLPLSSKDKERIRELYRIDYDHGWY